jgi:uncharacterized protein YecE (DUF72 family)
VPVLVGTSGWQYRDWRGRFYPQGLAQARWLEHYAERFATVESNNAFYRLPEAGTFAAWAERTPPGFVMAVKASRYLTHIKRLRDPEEPVGRLMERARHLGAKLGPVLLQPRRHTPVWRTADWTYLRLHEGTASPRPCYDRQALAAWAGRLAELMGPDADAYVYFNNDPGGCAVRDAVWFASEAAAAGLSPTRVPGLGETPVG